MPAWLLDETSNSDFDAEISADAAWSVLGDDFMTDIREDDAGVEEEDDDTSIDEEAESNLRLSPHVRSNPDDTIHIDDAGDQEIHDIMANVETTTNKENEDKELWQNVGNNFFIPTINKNAALTTSTENTTNKSNAPSHPANPYSHQADLHASDEWFAQLIYNDAEMSKLEEKGTVLGTKEIGKKCITAQTLQRARAAVVRAVTNEDDGSRFLGNHHKAACQCLAYVYNLVQAADTSHTGVSKLTLWLVYESLRVWLIESGARWTASVKTHIEQADAKQLEPQQNEFVLFATTALSRFGKFTCTSTDARLAIETVAEQFLPHQICSAANVADIKKLREKLTSDNDISEWKFFLSPDIRIHLFQDSDRVAMLSERSGGNIVGDYIVTQFVARFVATVLKKRTARDAPTTENDYLEIASRIIN